MATAVMVPLGEYLSTMYHPDCEWVDGELRERAVPEGTHAYLQTFFIRYFLLREEEFGVRVTQELRTQVAARRYRVPDVTVLRADAPFEEIVRTPPLLCIEVLSPGDAMPEVLEKIDDYVAMGVSAVWVLNPKRRTGYRAEGGALIPVEQLTVPGTEIRINVAEIFAGLDKLKGG